MLSGHRRVRLTGTPFAALRRLAIGASALRHNETPVLDYPERDWDLVAFPAQKGSPYVADNLATVNAHAFLNDPRFVVAEQAAAGRWTSGARDIRWRLHTFLWAVETALRTHREGDLVELGTGNGFMAAGACSHLEWGSGALTRGRRLWLIDSFTLQRPDEEASSAPQRHYYADGDEEVRAHFGRHEGVHVITGLLPDVADEVTSERLAFVHVDLNHAGSEIASLDRLASRMLPGALVLFDDSGNPGCTEQLEAHGNWAEARGAPFLLLPTGQGFCIVP